MARHTDYAPPLDRAERKLSKETRHLIEITAANLRLLVDTLIEIEARQEAITYNARTTEHLMRLRKHFELPSGNVIKIKKKN